MPTDTTYDMIEGEILLGWSFIALATNQSYFKTVFILLRCLMLLPVVCVCVCVYLSTMSYTGEHISNDFTMILCFSPLIKWCLSAIYAIHATVQTSKDCDVINVFFLLLDIILFSRD